jgi:Cytochrome oxidase complex assembly protein 1
MRKAKYQVGEGGLCAVAAVGGMIQVFEEEFMAAQNPILQGTVSGQMAVPHRSWLVRNWKWLLLVAFLAVIVFVAGLFTLIMGGMRSSDVAKEAVARAQASPLVTQRLGAAIDEGWMMSGSINVAAGGTGDADLAVPITGPKGKGTVYVTARKIAGTWNYTQMVAAIEGGGEKIDLLAGSASTQPDAEPASETAAPRATPAAETGAETSAPAVAATPQAKSSNEGLGSGDGDQTGTRAVITDLKRGGSTVTLKFTIYNDSNDFLNTGSRFDGSGYKSNGYRSFSGLHLIDSVSKKKYFVAADSENNCLCSEHVDDIKAKTQVSLWAKFPAPPDNVQKITVEIPHFIPIEDVPIR